MGHSARAWESAFLLTQSQGTPRLLVLGPPAIAKGGVEGAVGGSRERKGGGEARVTEVTVCLQPCELLNSCQGARALLSVRNNTEKAKHTQ